MKKNNFLNELEKTRGRYLKAKEKGDEVMMGLWEKVGKSLRKKLDERMGR